MALTTQQAKMAVDELLCAGSIRTEDFAAFLKAYQTPSGATTLMILEAQPRHVITDKERQGLLYFAHFDPTSDFTLYTSGRIFHKQGELRWERQQSEYQVVYTGLKKYQPEHLAISETNKVALDNTHICDRAYFLFGKRLDDRELRGIGPAAQDGDFAEVRIPRLLRYPRLENQPGNWQEVERIKLAICEYIDVQTGQNIAYRYRGLEYVYKKRKASKEVSA